MTTIKKLKSMPYAQAHIEIVDSTIYLYSYTTLVCEINNDGWLYCYGLYSMTTRKHISAFMKEYTGLSYDNAKKCYEGNYCLNIHTGEILEIE